MINRLLGLILDLGVAAATTWDLLFGCPHRRTTGPRRRAFHRWDQAPDYMACLDCGAQIDCWTFCGRSQVPGPRPKVPAPGSQISSLPEVLP